MTTCVTIFVRRRLLSFGGESISCLPMAISLRLAGPASGTHTGRSGGVAPTGKRAEFSGVNIFRFGDDGKVTEIWDHRDDLGLMEQLGAGVYAGAGGDVR